jgi:hypothetical protein
MVAFDEESRVELRRANLNVDHAHQFAKTREDVLRIDLAAHLGIGPGNRELRMDLLADFDVLEQRRITLEPQSYLRVIQQVSWHKPAVKAMGNAFQHLLAMLLLRSDEHCHRHDNDDDNEEE